MRTAAPRCGDRSRYAERQPSRAERRAISRKSKQRNAGPRVLYLAPCGLHEGVGGSARLRNMLDVLERVGAGTELLSYLPGEGFSVTRRRESACLTSTTIRVARSSPGPAKAAALALILLHGLRHVRRSDVVIAHAPGMASGFPALVLSRLFRKPLLVDHMDSRDPQTPAFVYRAVLRRADTVFAISRFLEAEASSVGCRRVQYLPIFVNTAVFSRDNTSRETVRKELGIGRNELVIGYAGSFWHVEGVPLLLRAFERLAARHRHVRLVLLGGRNVAGSDDIAGLIERLAIGDRVIAVPPQPYDRMPRYLSAFDIACSPKIDCPENRAANPVKIYEYMSMALPTVASAVGEIANVLDYGRDGFPVAPGDAGALERELERAVQNSGSLQDVGARAREKILESYAQQAIIQKVGDTLHRLCGNAGRGDREEVR